jgi:hypothetical protein
MGNWAFPSGSSLVLCPITGLLIFEAQPCSEQIEVVGSSQRFSSRHAMNTRSKEKLECNVGSTCHRPQYWTNQERAEMKNWSFIRNDWIKADRILMRTPLNSAQDYVIFVTISFLSFSTACNFHPVQIEANYKTILD